MRKAILVSVAAATTALAAAPEAHAGVGIGMFLGEPLGLTIKADLKKRTSLEFLIGVDDYDEDRGRDGYGHLTFLAAPFVARGDSVAVPFRIGLGVAVYDEGGADWGDDINIAARAPFQIAFQFKSTPLELYLELALRLELFDDLGAELDGGLGFRFYF